MKYIFIGDLHGKIEIAQHWLNRDDYDQLIFMGDYLDSYDRYDQDHVDLFELACDAVTNKPEKVRALIGNHELSYIKPNMRCSGHREYIQNYMDRRGTERALAQLDEFIVLYPNVLITHAGISSYMADTWNDALYVFSKEYLRDAIGERRGGLAPSGGPFWADYSELVPIPSIIQVTGHNRVDSIHYKEYNTGYIWFTDVLDTSNHALVLDTTDINTNITIDNFTVKEFTL